MGALSMDRIRQIDDVCGEEVRCLSRSGEVASDTFQELDLEGLAKISETFGIDFNEVCAFAWFAKKVSDIIMIPQTQEDLEKLVHYLELQIYLRREEFISLPRGA